MRRSLNHPNIVHIFDLGKIEAGGYFIAMEHVEGGTSGPSCTWRRRRASKLPVPLAVGIAAKVAAALDYAHHRRGDDGQDLHVVHRDVSPPNILVSTDGDIKLCDFRIAKAASKVSTDRIGRPEGKVPYMSPEQAWGRPVDQRSDIYSLGAVLFEMATGQKLFQGDSELNVLEKVRAGEVVLPSSLNPDVPPALDAAVLKVARPQARQGVTPTRPDMLRDLDAVLRTYEPPPSSADIAAYVRSLEAEDSARRRLGCARRRPGRDCSAVEEAGQAGVPDFLVSAAGGRRQSPSDSPSAPPARPAPPAPQTASAVKPPRRSRREPITTGVFAASFPNPPRPRKKRRARLYVMIAAATVVLAVAGWLVVRKPAPSLSSAPAVTRLPATPAAVVNAITPLPTPSVSAPDAKAIQEEAQRQLLARRKEMKAADAAAKSARAGAAKAPVPAPALLDGCGNGPGRSPEVKVVDAPAAAAEPTPAPAAEPPPTAPPRAPAVAPETAAEVSRGDLVGPGPGVVEPVYVSSPHRISSRRAPAGDHRQGRRAPARERGGAVLEAKLQQGLGSVFGVNEAVLASIRRAKFQPATKGGIPVKMWRTIVVDVKP